MNEYSIRLLEHDMAYAAAEAVRLVKARALAGGPAHAMHVYGLEEHVYRDLDRFGLTAEQAVKVLKAELVLERGEI